MNLSLPSRDPLRVLCLGAHSDDIEIGCGGTILRLLAERTDVHVDWVVLSARGERRVEAESAAERFLGGAGSSKVTAFEFQDGYLPWVGAAVKDAFEDLKPLEPDLIFTHRRDDRHQDHRMVSDLTWNTFRHHLILEYEIPKYDGDLGRPNVFVGLGDEFMDRKVDILMKCFASQRSKAWFSPETFRGLARIRGIEACGSEPWAEGFVGRKVGLELGIS